MTTTVHITTGGCHCGAIRFSLVSMKAPEETGIRACQCSFCMKHGARWTSDPKGSLAIEITAPELVERYRFATATAELLVCRRCGAVPAVLSDIDGQTYAALNVNTADDPGAFSATAEPKDFDGEEVADRLARRRENWIGEVTVTTGTE